jgi:hypothetical protein
MIGVTTDGHLVRARSEQSLCLDRSASGHRYDSELSVYIEAEALPR